jgi:hypothetical protein
MQNSLIRFSIKPTGLFLLLAAVCNGATADVPADQIERAQLLRELLETRSSKAESEAQVLPGANLGTDSTRAREASRRQQLEESQWRRLLGSQQMQNPVPSTQPIPEMQWRSQVFERERRGEDLSTDILRQSREYLSNGHR